VCIKFAKIWVGQNFGRYFTFWAIFHILADNSHFGR
jgi:hypothetical protein